nr:hypothetical protein [Tanacetum cinerariifolium]
MGDFNVALNLEDPLSCSSRFNSAMNDFKECVNKIEILDIKSSGLHFTWNQKPKNRIGLLKKLDRIISDLDEVQKALDNNPHDMVLREAEAAKFRAFIEAKLDEEQFLKQKAKIDWLEAGDSNSAIFHKSIKSKNKKSRIEVILDANNVEITESHVDISRLLMFVLKSLRAGIGRRMLATAILMGDFNVALNLEILDIKSFGLHFTWNQKPKNRSGLLKKLDRIMCNLDFVDRFQGTYGMFQPYRLSDHSPAVIKIPTLMSGKPKPFKFSNFLAYKNEFHEVVTIYWSIQINRYRMYQITAKLKALKKPMRKLLQSQGNLHTRVNSLRSDLDEVQKALDINPHDMVLREAEAAKLQAFMEAKLVEERFLKQKAKIDWLEVGDSNSAFFHKSIKSKNQKSRIEVILDANNVEITGPMVAELFVSHYKQFLGTNITCDNLDSEELFVKKISDGTKNNMVREVSNEEIKSAMFNIGDDRASGPDGFSLVFFKKIWNIVGEDVCSAIKDF